MVKKNEHRRASIPAPGALAQTIYTQIAPDWFNQAEQRRRVMAELQSKIFALNEELGPSLPPPKKR